MTTNFEYEPITVERLESFALIAGDIAKTHFTDFGMLRELKSDRTPVTVADKLINRKFIEFVHETWPGVDIIGEEESSRSVSDWLAITDPIDGTFPFTMGSPVFTNMFGMLYKGEPIMGVIYDPIMNRMFSAERGKGSFMNGRRLEVSGVGSQPMVERPMVGYVSWHGANNKAVIGGKPIQMLKAVQFLEDRGVSAINYCSIGIKEVMVASGELAGTIFPGVGMHDTAPGDIIVTEAGGTVTDLLGNPLSYDSGEILGHVMSNGIIHDLLLEAVEYAAA